MAQKSEEQIINEFKNLIMDLVSKAVSDNAKNISDDSFTGKRSQQELGKFCEGAMLLIDRMLKE